MIWVRKRETFLKIECFEGFEYEFIHSLGIELNSFESVLQLQDALITSQRAFEILYPKKSGTNLYKYSYGTRLN